MSWRHYITLSGWRAALARIPLIGGLLFRTFTPFTLYNIDTGSMFSTAMHRTATEALNEYIEDQELPPIPADELRPTMRDLFQ